MGLTDFVYLPDRSTFCTQRQVLTEEFFINLKFQL